MAEVDVPAVGKIDKRVVIGVGGVAAAYLGYRYYRNRNASADTSTDPDFEDPGLLPGVAGAIKPDNAYGSGDKTVTSDTTAFTTNAQWSQFALEKLSASDTWSYSDIAEALGNYLNDRPLTDQQIRIVTAALGVAGHEPVGSHSIKPGGNVDVTVAPTGVGAAGITPTAAQIDFGAVPGARTYNLYRSGSTAAVGTSGSSPIPMTNLTPNTKYTVQVAALSSSGAPGPKSSPISFTTAGVKMATPNRPGITSVTSNRVVVTTKSMPYATVYRWFINGRIVNTTDGPHATLTGLKPKTSYAVAVQTDTSTGSPSPVSATTTFKTK